MALLSAISSMSLGRAWVHPLPHKLDVAAKNNIHGLELFFEDLEHHALSLHGASTPVTRLLAAQDIARLCAARGLRIISMQPFYHYEGLKDRVEHQSRLNDAKEWFELARALGTDLILIPSNFLPKEDLCDDFDIHIQDLREIADLGLTQTPPIRFSYESLAWGTYVSTWERCWSVVAAVDRPNFGICLDAFNIAARVWADPAAANGRTPDGKKALQATLARMTSMVEPAKLFLVQIADAELLDEPLLEGHQFYDKSQPARMSWSRNCRLFYGEKGGYLPVDDIARHFVFELGYRGWVSAELFNRRMADEDRTVPEELGSRAAKAWKAFERDMGVVSTKEKQLQLKPLPELTIKVDEVLDA